MELKHCCRCISHILQRLKRGFTISILKVCMLCSGLLVTKILVLNAVILAVRSINHKEYSIPSKHNAMQNSYSKCMNFQKNASNNTLKNVYSKPITVISAFIRVGDFLKGDSVRHIYNYWEWAGAWKKLLNPVVLFTDCKLFAQTFANFRNKLPPNYTTISLIEKEKLWSFQFVSRIGQIFGQSSYLNYNYSHFVSPEYIAVTHSKCDFLLNVIQDNPYGSNCFMWLDVGYFRNYKPSHPCFKLMPPPDFNSSCIAVNKINDLLQISAKQVVLQNHVFVGGGLYFGVQNVLLKFIMQYRETVQAMLKRNLIGTEQALLYSLYSDSSLNISKPLVPLQLYEGVHTQYNSDPWFYLGHLMQKHQPCSKNL